MNCTQLIRAINKAYIREQPFFFMVDFDLQNGRFFTPKEAYAQGILFNFNQTRNYTDTPSPKREISIKSRPISFDSYKESYNTVTQNIARGNSYLVNLTASTPIECNASLSEIFHGSAAPYRLLYQNKFVVFSPETFVRVDKQTIYTHPMKGTIDATIPNAEKLLLSNPKEMAEHATTVDLLRNDLSRHAAQVKVDRFRYVETINSGKKKLLQVSSQISGTLPINYKHRMGNILFDMLPAGSISGAPKKRTIEIIKEAETHQRGYYTGIAGVFDGEKLDTCVLIRFIENQQGQLVYKSGGGITSLSHEKEEYNELIDKIYVPNC